MMLLFLMLLCVLQTSSYVSQFVNAGADRLGKNSPIITSAIHFFMALIFLITGLLVARKVNFNSAN